MFRPSLALMAPAVTPWDSSTPTDPRFFRFFWTSSLRIVSMYFHHIRNPGLRLFQFEQETGRCIKFFPHPIWILVRRILNFQQFFLNLTQANEEGRAEWQLEYDFLDYYGQLTNSLQTFATGFKSNTVLHPGLKDMTVSSVASLVASMEQGGPAMEKFLQVLTIQIFTLLHTLTFLKAIWSVLILVCNFD